MVQYLRIIIMPNNSTVIFSNLKTSLFNWDIIMTKLNSYWLEERKKKKLQKYCRGNFNY